MCTRLDCRKKIDKSCVILVFGVKHRFRIGVSDDLVILRPLFSCHECGDQMYSDQKRSADPQPDITRDVDSRVS